MCIAPTLEGNRKFATNPTVVGIGKAMGVIDRNRFIPAYEDLDPPSSAAPQSPTKPVVAPKNKANATDSKPVASRARIAKSKLNVKRRPTVNASTSGSGLNLNT